MLGALPGAVPCARLHARLVLIEWGLKALADRYQTGMTMHLSSWMEDVQGYLERTGMRPVKYYHRLAVLAPNVVLAHMVNLDDEEVELIDVARERRRLVGQEQESAQKLVHALCLSRHQRTPSRAASATANAPEPMRSAPIT